MVNDIFDNELYNEIKGKIVSEYLIIESEEVKNNIKVKFYTFRTKTENNTIYNRPYVDIKIPEYDFHIDKIRHLFVYKDKELSKTLDSEWIFEQKRLWKFLCNKVNECILNTLIKE